MADNVGVTVTIENNLPQASEALEYALKQWANRTGGEMVNLTHRDKASGGTPVDTGRLRNSMTYRTEDENRTVVVGTNVEYGIYVEEGARGRRPARMLRNAVTDVADDAKDWLQEALEDNGM